MGKLDDMYFKNLFKFTPGLLDESIGHHEYGIRVYKNNYMYQNIEQTMQRIIEAGIPEAHLKFIMDTVLYSQPQEPYEPKVFGLKDLEFGFVVWLCACFFAITVFVIEWIWPKFVKFVRNLVGRMIILNFVRRHWLL
jgi:hypothetical protein